MSWCAGFSQLLLHTHALFFNRRIKGYSQFHEHEVLKFMILSWSSRRSKHYYLCHYLLCFVNICYRIHLSYYCVWTWTGKVCHQKVLTILFDHGLCQLPHYFFWPRLIWKLIIIWFTGLWWKLVMVLLVFSVIIITIMVITFLFIIFILEQNVSQNIFTCP